MVIVVLFVFVGFVVVLFVDVKDGVDCILVVIVNVD